jgi:5-deoxy-glucuronate isomerase
MDTKTNQKLLIKHLETQNEEYELDVTPELAGWTYSGLKILNLKPKEVKTIYLESCELCVLPLSAVNIIVKANDNEYYLKGRSNVFTEITDFIYIPLNTKFELYNEFGGKIALPYSKCTKKFDIEYVDSSKVQPDFLGAGQATRQRNNFCGPTNFLNADKLVALEVITPAGNWSSYPPHKHDTQSDCEAQLEEIYYIIIDDPKGFAFIRTYTKDGTIDATETIRSGDVFLVPRGYHGPLVTPPGYNLYQINVMAGPAEKRTMQFCDDPDYAWIRSVWEKEAKDTRLPLKETKI